MQLGEWSSGIGKHLVKIEDGKSVVGVFRGETVRFYQHWKSGRPAICQGRVSCEMCNSPDEKERKAVGRFRVNFVTKVGDQPTAMIFEGGRRAWEQMAQLNKDVPLEKAWVRISRTGTGTNTQYMLQIPPGNAGMLTADQEKTVLSVALHDLSLNKVDDADDEDLSA